MRLLPYSSAKKSKESKYKGENVDAMFPLDMIVLVIQYRGLAVLRVSTF
jgi:hypothetical protein